MATPEKLQGPAPHDPSSGLMESLAGVAVTGRGSKQGPPAGRGTAHPQQPLPGWGDEPGGSQPVPGQKPRAGGHGAVKGNTGASDPGPARVESWLREGTGCRLLPAGVFSSDTAVVALSLAWVAPALCAGGFAAPSAAGPCLSHPSAWEGLAPCSMSCPLSWCIPQQMQWGPPRLPITKQRPIPGIRSCPPLRLSAPLGVSPSPLVFWSRPQELLDDSPPSPASPADVQALKAAQVLPSWGSHWAGMMKTRHRHQAGHRGPVGLWGQAAMFP